MRTGTDPLRFFGATLRILTFISAMGAPLLAQEAVSRTAADTKLDEILARLATIEQRLTTLEGTTAPVPPREVTLQSAPSTSDLAARLEAIDEQVRIVDRRREIDQEALTSRFSRPAALATLSAAESLARSLTSAE